MCHPISKAEFCSRDDRFSPSSFRAVSIICRDYPINPHRRARAHAWVPLRAFSLRMAPAICLRTVPTPTLILSDNQPNSINLPLCDKRFLHTKTAGVRRQPAKIETSPYWVVRPIALNFFRRGLDIRNCFAEIANIGKIGFRRHPCLRKTRRRTKRETHRRWRNRVVGPFDARGRNCPKRKLERFERTNSNRKSNSH